MASQYASITEKIVNNNTTRYMRLDEFRVEQKKHVAALHFSQSSGTSLTVQLPQCCTKAGIVEQASKTYTDLLFDSTTEGVKEMVDMLIAIEEESAKQLHDKKGEWLDGDAESMTLQAFEDMFTPAVRYVNRQQNVCVRVNIPMASTTRGIKQTASVGYECDVYDKKGKARLLSDVRADTKILPLVEVKDARLTSSSINIHIDLVECMIVEDSPSVVGGVDEPLPQRRIQLGGAEVVKEETVCSIAIHQDTVPGEDVPQVCDDGKGDAHCDTQYDNVDVPAKGENEPTECDSEAVECLEEEKRSVGDDGGNDEYRLEEVGTLVLDEAEPIKLKRPDEVYKDIYKAAITKAKKLRQVAIEAYLEAKKIKAKFMLDDDEDGYDSDDSDDEEADAELEEVTNLSPSNT